MRLTRAHIAETSPRRRVHVSRRLAASHWFASVIAFLALGMLAGCSSLGVAGVHHSASPSVSSSPVYPQDASGSGKVQAIGATCAVLSTIETNLNNGYEDHQSGKLSDNAYSAIINTTSPDLRVVLQVDGFGLQPDLKRLDLSVEHSASKLPGAEFDPGSTAFADAMIVLAKQCSTNGSPISISSTSG
jgi:hypothetical protein